MIEFSHTSGSSQKTPPPYPVCTGSLLPVRIEPLDRQKKKVFLEDGTVLHLYNSEIRTFELQEYTILEGDAYTELMQRLCKRARARAMHLLKNADRPSTEIARKLQTNGYPEEAIADAVAYLLHYGYIDDTAYIQRYFAANKNKKSRQQIRFDLLRKGLDTELVDDSLAEEESDSDTEAALLLLQKYCRNKDAADPAVRQKAFAYLMRRGFSMSDIQHVYEEYDKLNL